MAVRLGRRVLAVLVAGTVPAMLAAGPAAAAPRTASSGAPAASRPGLVPPCGRRRPWWGLGRRDGRHHGQRGR